MEDLQLTESILSKKLVALGCDGASVMCGKTSGVSALLKKIQPSLIVVHCMAHRLELAYKDAIKGIKVYDSVIVLLMGLYYLYHNSPKQREILRNAYASLEMKETMPTRVSGTRWVGHLLLSVENFLKGFRAFRNHIEDCVNQSVKVSMLAKFKLLGS